MAEVSAGLKIEAIEDPVVPSVVPSAPPSSGRVDQEQQSTLSQGPLGSPSTELLNPGQPPPPQPLPRIPQPPPSTFVETIDPGGPPSLGTVPVISAPVTVVAPPPANVVLPPMPVASADPDAWKVGDQTPTEQKPIEQRHGGKPPIEESTVSAVTELSRIEAKAISNPAAQESLTGLATELPSAVMSFAPSYVRSDESFSEFLPVIRKEAVGDAREDNLSSVGKKEKLSKSSTISFRAGSGDLSESTVDSLVLNFRSVTKEVSGRFLNLSAALASKSEIIVEKKENVAPRLERTIQIVKKEERPSAVAKLWDSVAAKFTRQAKSAKGLAAQFKKPSKVGTFLAGMFPKQVAETFMSEDDDNTLLTLATGFLLATLFFLPFILRRKRERKRNA